MSADRGDDAFDADAVEAEVRAAFEAYERALIANDVAATDAAFWDDERVVRFGVAEIQHGFAEWPPGGRRPHQSRRAGGMSVSS